MRYVTTVEEANKVPFNEAAAVLRRTRTKPELLELFRTHPDVDVLKLVAENPNTPQATLQELAENGSRHIVQSLANNPMISSETGEMIIRRALHFGSTSWGMKSSNPIVHVLNNRPDDVNLIELAFNDTRNVDVMLVLAANLNTPVWVLKTLINADSRRTWMKIIHAAAANPTLPFKEMRVQYSDTPQMWAEMSGYARNVNLPLTQMEEFLHSEEWKIRFALMSNPNFPQEWFDVLKNDPNDMVRNRAYFHAPPEESEGMPDEWLASLYDYRRDYFTYENIIRPQKMREECNLILLSWREKYNDMVRQRYAKGVGRG